MDTACRCGVRLIDVAETTELYYSKFYALVVIAVSTAVLCTSGPLMLGLALMKGYNIIGIPGLVILGLILLGLYWHAFPMLFHQDAVVIFDADGVTDRRQQESFAAWDDIGDVRLGVGETRRFLCFKFRSAETSRHYVGRPYVLRMLYLNIRFLSDWNVNLMSLRCSNAKVLKLARAMHKQSIRRRVIRMRQEAAAQA